MKLTVQAVRIYQYSAIFFSATSLLLINHPAIILTPIFIVLTLTLYVTRSLKKLKRIDENYFKSSLTISPNILLVGEKATVRVHVKCNVSDKYRGEVQVILDEGLKIDDGRSSWTGIIDSNQEILLEFIVKIGRAGLIKIGPIILVVKDDLDFVAKTIKLDNVGIIFSFQEPLRTRGVLTTSAIRGSIQPGYTLNPFIGIDEEYRESVESLQSSLKKVDWRRTARIGGEEVYVKDYAKRRSSDIIIGVGSGLDLDIPSIGNIKTWVMQIIISYALHYLREGSRMWILEYDEEKPIYIQLKHTYGELILKDEVEPSGGIIIYISRLIMLKELDFLNKNIDLQRFKLEVLILDISDEVIEIVKEDAINYEVERLRKLKTELRDSVKIVKLKDLLEGLRRSLASR
ncbi:MAG: hypothetical protein N3G77_03205 [Nitrososphaeria archaeon]|nr:hypothetical protein [Nitrososphaeria archaeon]